MVSPLAASRPPVRALVVDSDSQALERICETLTRKGIEVCACRSLSQGRELFSSQPIVLARSPGRGAGGSEFKGFVDWVRESAGGSQPYILAIDDQTGKSGDPMVSAAANPGCNAVMATPGDDRAMEERLAEIDRWLDSCGHPAVKPRERAAALPPRVDSPFEKAPEEAVAALDGQAKVARALEERDLLLQMAENLPVGIVLFDPEGKVVYTNPQHAAVLGFDASESADAESWLRRACPDGDSAQEAIEAWREYVWRRQVSRVLTLVTSEGLLKDVRFDSKLLEDGILLVSFSDVTEARRLEEALHASEARHRAFFQGSCVGMALVDRGGDFFDINAALEGMLCYPRWELRSKPLNAFICAEDLAGFEAIDPVNGVGDAGIREVEVRLIRKNQRLLWVRLTASPVRDQDGNLLFTAYTVCDIEGQLRTKRECNRRRLLENAGNLLTA